MGKREEPLVFRPVLLKQIPFVKIQKDMPEEEKEEKKGINKILKGKRDAIAKTNTSRFFTQLYRELYGGNIQKDVHGNLNLILRGRPNRNFGPDIISSNGNGTSFTEVKTNSIQRSSPYCSIRQLENYCFSLLKKFEEGDPSPEVNYVFFRYGTRNTRHLGLKPTNGLVKTLIGEKKFLTQIPLNLVFFLLAFSRFEDADHTTSDYGRDSESYFRPLGSSLTTLHSNEDAINELIDEHSNNGYNPTIQNRRYIGDLGDLFLDRLHVERTTSSKIRVKYQGEQNDVEPFSITRYFLPEETRREWLIHFSQHHKRMMDNLGLMDIYEDDIPF